MSTDADHETGDRVGLHDGTGEPVLLVAPETRAADVHLLIQRLRSFGYDVDKEYANDNQAAYRVHWPAEGGHA